MYFFSLLKIIELSDLFLRLGRPENEQSGRWMPQHRKNAFQTQSGSFRWSGWEWGGLCNQFPLAISLSPSQQNIPWVMEEPRYGAETLLPSGEMGLCLCASKPQSFRCQTLPDWFSLFRKPRSLLNVSSLILLPTSSQCKIKHTDSSCLCFCWGLRILRFKFFCSVSSAFSLSSCLSLISTGGFRKGLEICSKK